jgi:Na+/melibiose symporter-like transporter
VIITCKKHIPPHWLVVTIMPWAAWMFVYCVMSVAFLFSLKKFVENPAGLTFVMSLPGFVSIVVGSSVSFMSDRIWTRFGRRKPFVITAWTLCGICVAAMPLMPNFWLLLGAYMLFNIGSDLQTTQEPLKQEIIPPSQRGRAVAGVSWMTQLGLLMFFSVALGRFDDRMFYLGVPITGEQSIYWAAASGMLVMTLLICLGIKEVDPRSKILGVKFNPKNFFRGILNHNLWPVYLLVFGSAMLTAGLGVAGNLLYTDQWHFTKQEMGNNVAIGGVINLFLIVIVGWFADKMNRVRAYQILIVLSLLINLSFYLYVNFVLYDRRPILLELVLFGEALSIIGMLTNMVYMPLVYDYVPRNEMGTYMAGSNLLQRLTGLITLNGLGLFIWLYAVVFLPSGGEMTRVVFRESLEQKQVAAVLAQSIWRDLDTGQPRPAKDISAEPWYATGAVLKYGHAYELRLSDPRSVALKKERDTVEELRGKSQGEEATLRARARLLLLKDTNSPAAANLLTKADKLKADAAPLAAQVGQLDAELQQRGDALRAQAVTNLAPLLLRQGAQIQRATFGAATIVEFATQQRPVAEKLERVLEALRRERADVIDLRPVKTAGGYAVAVSLAGTVDPTTADALNVALASSARRSLPGVFDGHNDVVSVRSVPLLEMDLLTVEEPLILHLSPVSCAINAVLGIFTVPPAPERRLSALGRGLRELNQIEHVGVQALGQADGPDHAIRVRAVLDKQASVADKEAMADEIGQRLAVVLGGANELHLAQARAFYDRVVTAGSEQRITVAAPVLADGFTPMKYDYMAAYLCMLMLGVIGLLITFLFIRRERRGLIRKRGVEEAEAA